MYSLYLTPYTLELHGAPIMQPWAVWKPVTIDPAAFGEPLLPLPLLLRILATSSVRVTYRGNGETHTTPPSKGLFRSSLHSLRVLQMTSQMKRK